ncbi:MAG: glycosyltransferase [Saprospiraceae bacterium]|nr:glycosyltransferase [Saprospiraceae bacterium]
MWVVSFHDLPYLEKRNNLVLLPFQDWVWKNLLKKSDLVLAVSNGVGDALQRYDCKAVVIENGIVPRQPQSAKNQKFTVAFTGSLYSGLIDPVFLFKALEDLLTHSLLKKT